MFFVWFFRTCRWGTYDTRWRKNMGFNLSGREKREKLADKKAMRRNEKRTRKLLKNNPHLRSGGRSPKGTVSKPNQRKRTKTSS